MTSLFVGLYGLYLLIVGSRGNVNALMNKLGADGRGYIPWLFAIIMIALLNESEVTAPLVKPFVFLLILTFVLRNFGTIETQVSEIYNLSRS